LNSRCAVGIRAGANKTPLSLARRRSARLAATSSRTIAFVQSGDFSRVGQVSMITMPSGTPRQMWRRIPCGGTSVSID
jgi:hypothetical protein